MRSLDEDNRVLNEGDTVSMEKLMGLMKKRRNSILVLIGTGSVGSEEPSESDTLNVMDALAQLNNKKANKLCREVRFYNGENRALDWIAEQQEGQQAVPGSEILQRREPGAGLDSP